jgi:hypothetical protein
MTAAQREIADRLAAALAAGTLTVEDLRQGMEEVARSPGARQDILYLQAANTSPTAGVVGMMLIEDGAPVETPADADVWPYQTVLEAVNDGWRIISFPNMALLSVSEDDPHGLGFEFILERWS